MNCSSCSSAVGRDLAAIFQAADDVDDLLLGLLDVREPHRAEVLHFLAEQVAGPLRHVAEDLVLQLGAGALQGHRPLRAFHVLQQRLDVAVGKLGDVLEDEHQAADFLDQVGVFLGEVFQQAPLRRAVDDVEDLGHAGHAAGVLELLAHHARHAVLQPLLHLLDDLRAGLPHGGHAADHRQLAVGGQPADDLGRLLRRQVGEDQGDGLRVLVDDEGQQVLAVDLLQEAEGEGLDRLADVVQRGGGAFAQGPLDQVAWPRPARRPGRSSPPDWPRRSPG